MNDDTIAVNSTAITTEAEEETVAPAPQAPKRKPRAKAVRATEVKEPETPRAEREPDPLLFAMLLKTQRAMEKEARSAKLSSLRIVLMHMKLGNITLRLHEQRERLAPNIEHRRK